MRSVLIFVFGGMVFSSLASATPPRGTARSGVQRGVGARARVASVEAPRRTRQQARNAMVHQAREWSDHFVQRMIVALEDGGTPPLIALPSRPTQRLRMTVRRLADDGETHPSSFDITNIGSRGRLPVRLLLPASAHNGSLEHYARTNVYNVRITRGDGTVLPVQKVRSTGFVTEHEIIMQLAPGRNLIEFWPEGTGVGSYREGRQVEYYWDGV